MIHKNESTEAVERLLYWFDNDAWPDKSTNIELNVKANFPSLTDEQVYKVIEEFYEIVKDSMSDS